MEIMEVRPVSGFNLALAANMQRQDLALLCCNEVV